MDAVGLRLVFAPGSTAATLAFALAGAGLGAVSGLLPGVHANNFALLLAAVAPSLPGPPAAVGAAMLAAGVVHTFLDVVPALAFGVPDPAMAATALPGHRLVLAGRGREALRLSALGSGLAVALSLPLAVPVTRAMVAAHPFLGRHLAVVLAVVVAALLSTEGTLRATLAGVVVLSLAAVLGLLTLDLSPPAPLPVGGMLAPLFAGLFGAPVLIDAAEGDGVPPQGDAAVSLPPRTVGATALAGTVGGAVVGYLPGVSAAVAAVLSLPAIPGEAGDRGYLVATSGANTATTVFALFALAALGTPHTGVLVALERASVPRPLSTLVAVVVLGSVVGFALVPRAGDVYLRVVGRLSPLRVSAAILSLLVAVSWLFAGGVGVAVFAVAAALGLVPPRLGTRRVYLMGVLLGPLVLGG
ncbi:MAG: tripartite tricarboxylate transporter permease [Haloferacaceae archaeon]